MDKNGLFEIGNLFKPFNEDNKVIYQSFKILNKIAKNNKEKIDFFDK